MTRVESIRDEVLRLVRAEPFEPFVLTLENGDRLVIDHPENIAFDPESSITDRRAGEFYVLSRQIRLFSNFEAVTSVALADRG
jgi:hypothetical protein